MGTIFLPQIVQTFLQKMKPMYVILFLNQVRQINSIRAENSLNNASDNKKRICLFNAIYCAALRCSTTSFFQHFCRLSHRKISFMLCFHSAIPSHFTRRKICNPRPSRFSRVLSPRHDDWLVHVLHNSLCFLTILRYFVSTRLDAHYNVAKT